MPFFLPSRLTEFEYFTPGETDNKTEAERAEEDKYRRVIDFAFFAAFFGYTKADYYELTPCDISFMLKIWEDKIVSETTHIRNATLNAIANANRKKGASFTELWKKRITAADIRSAEQARKIVDAVNSKDGNAWIAAIYGAKK